MGFTRFAVMLYVTMIHLVSGIRFMNPEPDTPPTSTPDSYPLGDLIHAALQSKEYLGRASAGTGTTTNPTQAVPGLGQTESAATVISPGLLTTALSSSSAASQTGSRNTMSLLPIEEETTTTLITTTTITTMHMPVQCNATLLAMEDVVESPDPSPSSSFSPLECTYSITVYAGYGVEIQVRKVNLSKEESLMIMGYGGTGPELLANETLMREGQVIRSTTNQVYIHYRSLRQTNHGMFSLHYQAFLLSCPFPLSPEGGGVTVTDIHPRGQAHFHCDPGFQVRGHEVATCVNTTQPHWSTPEPQCVAVSCGGWIRNATVGRILSPPPPSVSNHSNGNNLSCHWLIEAKEGHRLHLHFERIALDEDDDKLIVRSGNSSLSPPLFDSDLDDVPERGLLSESSTLYLELTADSSSIPLLLALRYEAFDDEHCWEPYMPHGNFSSSDITYQLGTTVTFTCSPGFVMEQGSGTIECVDPSNPHWNDSEPVCRALCGGELTEPMGTILSPDWPQSYSKGLDCVWQIHGNEEKRIELDVQILNIRHTDVLTVFDGRDLMSHVIGQYLGSRERFQVVSGSEVTIQFQSDPDDSSFILSQGFLIHYRGKYTQLTHFMAQSVVEPNDTFQQCPDPGEVVNGARSVRPEAGFAVGTVVRFSCNQGYQLEGPSQISCHGRDTGTPKWSDRSPKCVLKYDPCPNPGVPDNGYQTLYKHSYQAGETLRFFCYEGYELIGEVIISCVPGHPSQWNSPPPFCKGNSYVVRTLSQSFEPSHQILSENIALAIILPIILVILLIGGIYMYYTNICRLEWKPLFWKSLSHTHSYSPITVESDFNNPLYEAGDTREYEVSI
uniref:Seizure related 6 homolog like 2 n=1 Tax=Seriola dumerili TaxID=41447 RepID=A0A3B4UZV7_SERDU